MTLTDTQILIGALILLVAEAGCLFLGLWLGWRLGRTVIGQTPNIIKQDFDPGPTPSTEQDPYYDAMYGIPHETKETVK